VYSSEAVVLLVDSNKREGAGGAGGGGGGGRGGSVEDGAKILPAGEYQPS